MFEIPVTEHYTVHISNRNGQFRFIVKTERCGDEEGALLRAQEICKERGYFGMPMRTPIVWQTKGELEVQSPLIFAGEVSSKYSRGVGEIVQYTVPLGYWIALHLTAAEARAFDWLFSLFQQGKKVFKQEDLDGSRKSTIEHLVKKGVLVRVGAFYYFNPLITHEQ